MGSLISGPGPGRVAALVTLLLLGCSSDDKNQDEDGALALLARVEREGYRDWARAPGWAERSGPSVHSESADIFINDPVAALLASGQHADAFPVGSVIVKDGYNGDELALTAIMEKRSDGWYWAEYSAAGEPAFSGHPDVCIDCHRIGSDHVRAFALP